MKMLVTEGRIGIRKCAFCRHWYDPTNSAITPVKAKMWEYDQSKTSVCRKRNNLKKKACATCNKFECKL